MAQRAKRSVTSDGRKLWDGYGGKVRAVAVAVAAVRSQNRCNDVMSNIVKLLLKRSVVTWKQDVGERYSLF